MRYRFCVISLITILLTFVMCPIIKTQSFVYADSTTDQWESVTTNEELAEAFRYYCKSRNLSIEGSALDAVSSFTTSTFNNLCNTVGVDMTALQANLKKSTDSNGKLQFLFDSTGISTYNRLFAEFLQNNDLAEGDTVADQELINGKFASDENGNGHFVYVINYYNNSGVNILSEGTPFIVGETWANSHQIGDISNYSFTYNDVNYSYTLEYAADENYYKQNVRFYSPTNSTLRFIYRSPKASSSSYDKGLCGYIYNNITHELGFGLIVEEYNYDGSFNARGAYKYYVLEGGTLTDANVYITTNNQTINNTTYEGDTIINNEGDTINQGGGESGGGESGGDTNIDIDFPDFNFPNIPNIDFNLGDLSHKFPFSIPFDLVAFFTVLNADPIAPAIDRTIPLPDPIDDWHFQADFSQFDNYAVIIRNVEYIGFVIGLIYLTVRFVKG